MRSLLIIVAITFLVPCNPSKSDLSPSPTPYFKNEFLSIVTKDGAPSEYLTLESSIQAFHDLVDEHITTVGKISEEATDIEAGFIEYIIPILIAEHYAIRGNRPEIAIEKFGKPNRILKVKEDSEIFLGFVPIGWNIAKGYQGRPGINIQTRAPIECYEYDDFYIWVIGRDKDSKIADEVLAISPRSLLYDRYINNMDIFEK